MTEDQVREQLQAAQDLVDALTDQRNQSHNAMAQINAMRRAEQRQIQTLKDELQVALAKVAEMEERLSQSEDHKPNGAAMAAAA